MHEDLSCENDRNELPGSGELKGQAPTIECDIEAEHQIREQLNCFAWLHLESVLDKHARTSIRVAIGALVNGKILRIRLPESSGHVESCRRAGILTQVSLQSDNGSLHAVRSFELTRFGGSEGHDLAVFRVVVHSRE